MQTLSYLCALVFLALSGQVSAQLDSPVHWTYQAQTKGKQTAAITMTAHLQPGWHIFSQKLKAGGPSPTSIQIAPSSGVELLGTPTEPVSIVVYEKLFKMDIAYFENQVNFQQEVRFKKLPFVLKGKIEFMACNKKECLPPDEVEFAIPVNSAQSKVTRTKTRSAS